MIILINGPLGIGKTTLSWELLRHFERAVMLDGDHIGAVHPFEIYDERRIEYLYQTLRHLVAYHIQHGGYRDFVINYVFESPESLDRLRHLLSDLDERIYAFRLVCDEEEMARRIRQRGRSAAEDPQRLSWELERFRQLLAIQEEASLRGDLGLVIDTTHLTADQAAQNIWEIITEEILLAPYDPRWADAFAAEAERVRRALEPLALDIQHIGSTAVPGLSAKPVIDILIAVGGLDQALDCIAPLRKLGYAFVDHPENTDRRFFRKGLPRTHHLHIVESDSPSWRDHLDFRDALRLDPDLRRAYQQLKSDLASHHKKDRAAYAAAKGAFVAQALADYRHRI